jgi:hypothetical protein
MMATTDLYRLASMSSWAALVALVLSGIALALFFGGAGEFWGPVNDALIVITAIALLPVVAAVVRMAGDRGSPWVTLVSGIAVVGLILIAVGQTLLIVGRLSLDGSYVTGGLGVTPVIAWIVLVAILALGLGVLPSLIGWLAVLTLVAIVVFSVTAAITLGPVLWVEAVGLVAVMSLWLGSLATTFADSASIARAAATA